MILIQAEYFDKRGNRIVESVKVNDVRDLLGVVREFENAKSIRISPR